MDTRKFMHLKIQYKVSIAIFLISLSHFSKIILTIQFKLQSFVGDIPQEINI